MNDNNGVFIVLILVVVVIIGIMVGNITSDVTDDSWKQECIERNVAEYDSKTGQWQWKKEYPKEIKMKEDK